MECRFEGTARRIELRGQGTTSLVRAVAFEEGLAARVELATAKVGPRYAPVTIEAPATLDPVDLDPSATAYGVVYELGAKAPGTSLRIEIAAGAAREGRFQGQLADAPGCGEGDGCKVVWSDAKQIVLTVHPAAAVVAAAAQKGAPIRLTGWFPFVEHAEGEASPDRLDRVELNDAVGTLVCDGTRTEVKGKLVWSPTEHESARIGWPAAPGREAAGIAVTPDGLRLTVISSFTPEGAAAGASQAAWSAAAATVLVIVVVTLVTLVVRARRRKRAAPGPSSQAGGVSSAGSSGAPAPLPKGEGEPVAIVLLAAMPDAAFSAALARQLYPYRKRLFNPHDNACLAPGKDLLEETGKAIRQARVVAVVASADFFSAGEPWSSLLALALEQRAARGLIVVPVLARPSAWQAEATGLRGLVPLPAKGEIGTPDNDAALDEVAAGLVALG